ncbi:type III secretion system outer membrane ring subunit SctC [Limnobacter alexandrii]|uniref:type III secretion system outer membrane ring subunit SctC n=1 Tax=Limnobacter alexandrii TaxID=2570352 RepID=UPI001107ECC4|nr:type III secretion system outer membrane ring subunit SctC [Limnobacter alexandrii]
MKTNRKALATLILSLIAITSFAEGIEKSNAPLQRPYKYMGEGESVQQIIQTFAKRFGLQVNMHTPLRKPVHGRIEGDTAVRFLDELASSHGFSWFVQGSALHIADSADFVVRAFSVPDGAAESLKKALTEVKLLDPKFGWGSIDNNNTVIVSGPSAYVESIGKQLQQLGSGLQTQTFIYRLKHAAVEDRVVRYRDREIITPGVASILQRTIGSGKTTHENEKAVPLMASPVPGALSMADSQDGVISADMSNDKGKNSGSRISGTALVESDPRLNAIIIRDHPSRFTYYEKLLAELDTPSALIEIEASIMEVELNRLDEFSSALAYGSEYFSFNASTQPGNGTDVGLGKNGSAVVNNIQGFNARIRALEQDGEAKVLASPRILTVNNLGAFLDLTETFFSRVSGERVANLVPVTAGTTLRVTPRVIEENGNKRIQLILDIEDGTLDTINSTNDLPLVRKTNISTQAVIREGQSLLIGGYNVESSNQTSSRVPFLSSIPLIGKAFTSEFKNNIQRKRLFMITPRIVENAHSQSSDKLLFAPSLRVPAAPIKHTPKNSPVSFSITSPDSQSLKMSRELDASSR